MVYTHNCYRSCYKFDFLCTALCTYWLGVGLIAVNLLPFPGLAFLSLTPDQLKGDFLNATSFELLLLPLRSGLVSNTSRVFLILFNYFVLKPTRETQIYSHINISSISGGFLVCSLRKCALTVFYQWCCFVATQLRYYDSAKKPKKKKPIKNNNNNLALSSQQRSNGPSLVVALVYLVERVLGIKSINNFSISSTMPKRKITRSKETFKKHCWFLIKSYAFRRYISIKIFFEQVEFKIPCCYAQFSNIHLDHYHVSNLIYTEYTLSV